MGYSCKLWTKYSGRLAPLHVLALYDCHCLRHGVLLYHSKKDETVYICFSFPHLIQIQEKPLTDIIGTYVSFEAAILFVEAVWSSLVHDYLSSYFCFLFYIWCSYNETTNGKCLKTNLGNHFSIFVWNMLSCAWICVLKQELNKLLHNYWNNHKSTSGASTLFLFVDWYH